MNGFDSLNSRIITRLSSLILSNIHTGGIIKINRDREFANDVKHYSGLDLTIERKNFNNNFPQLAYNYCSITKGKIKIVSASAEVSVGDGLKVSQLKAKCEFLERISSLFPLNEFIDKDFNPDQVSQQTPLLLRAKKLFSFGYKKIHSAQVFYGLFRTNKIELYKKIGYSPTTNGGAGHFHYENATLNGLLELIQRDAFFVYWLNSIAPEKIQVESYLQNEQPDSEPFRSLKKIVSDFKKYNLEYYFLDITSDINVPTVCCVLVANSPTGKRMAIGAGCGFNNLDPILSAATEALAVLNAHFFEQPFFLSAEYKPFSDSNIKRAERLRIYTTDEMVDKVSFFFSSPKSISVEEWLRSDHIELCFNPKKSLQYLKKFFKNKMKQNAAYEVLVYQIHNSLLTHFDYTVVRVICEALYSLYLDENFANPHHPRLREFVKNKGLESTAKINPWPHPFP